MYILYYFIHFMKNSLRPNLKITIMFNMGDNKHICYTLLSSRTLFKLKMICKGLTLRSLTFVNGGDLKPLRINTWNFNPLSSSSLSRKIGWSFLFLTPSSPTKGDYEWDGTHGRRDGKNKGAHWGGDIEPWCNKGKIGGGDGVLGLRCNSMPSSCLSNWTMVLRFPPRP